MFLFKKKFLIATCYFVLLFLEFFPAKKKNNNNPPIATLWLSSIFFLCTDHGFFRAIGLGWNDLILLVCLFIVHTKHLSVSFSNQILFFSLKPTTLCATCCVNWFWIICIPSSFRKLCTSEVCMHANEWDDFSIKHFRCIYLSSAIHEMFRITSRHKNFLWWMKSN